VPQRLAREAAPIVVFGSLESEYLAIRVFGRMHDASDYWDGNWVDAEVSFQTHGFSGTYRAGLRTEEFERLYNDLIPLYESLQGHASLHSLEEWINIDIEGDGKGHCPMQYVAVSRHSPRTALASSLGLDQTYLPPVIDQLARILGIFPVIGVRPDATRPPS
jgi:hypothetical protein